MFFLCKLANKDRMNFKQKLFWWTNFLGVICRLLMNWNDNFQWKNHWGLSLCNFLFGRRPRHFNFLPVIHSFTRCFNSSTSVEEGRKQKECCDKCFPVTNVYGANPLCARRFFLFITKHKMKCDQENQLQERKLKCFRRLIWNQTVEHWGGNGLYHDI